MGCLAPSSKYLANAMARATDRAELVVELGAGTGSVTKALIGSHPDVPLIAVELESGLAKKLQQKFPEIDVRHDTAKQVIDGFTGIKGSGSNIFYQAAIFSIPRNIGAICSRANSRS